jgi:hypothetical protein
MDLQKAADEAMTYLDSVCVAADYQIVSEYKFLLITCYVNNRVRYFECYERLGSICFMYLCISSVYPQKEPEILTEDYLEQYSKRKEYFDFFGMQKSPN